jgi:hypothetical protein
VAKSGRKKGQIKKYPFDFVPVILKLTREEKDKYEKEASTAGYTLNVYLREKLKRG